ncbi:MAG: SDR family oxidoreductase [Eubacteriales bacterium]|jgi:3-oxoacyl-[acyl-carrier protein] reductase|nr:SDR family oxidoreductase [Eubacteriales bacterium]
MFMKKTVVVTGGAQGIGKACSLAFARAGYNVLINYNKSCEAALALADKLKQEGGFVAAFKADVAKRQEVFDMARFCIDTFGSIDVLVNNAGIAQCKLFTDITEDEWDNMININLKGVFNCSQAFLPYMIRKKYGRIINVSSVWGVSGASCEVHYSAAKAGVIGLTKALAKEVAPSGITVNCIAPGIIDTSMICGFSDEEINSLKNEIPACRIGVPEDVANCALFLAGEGSGYVTGQVISTDGGFAV